MESTNTQTTNPQVDHITDDFQAKVLKKQTSEQLLNGLYKIWDAFERANVEFFLVGQTYYDAKGNRDLVGDKVTVGVRKNEWISGGRRLIDAFIVPQHETEDLVTYEFEGVPVELRVYKDSDCILNCDTINYRHETFKTPNPYPEFVKQYA